MPGLNVVFTGNLLYPEGMADTKRFQHFIDGVLSEAGNTAHVLLLRQSHPGPDERRFAGEHRGVRYDTVGHDLVAGVGLPLALMRYLVGGCRFLLKARRRGARNVLFVYCEPTIESLAFVVWARLLGYRVVVDIVEDRYLIAEAAPLLSRLKARSVQWTVNNIHRLADGVVVISSYLQRKLEGIVAGAVPVQLIPVAVDVERVPGSTAGFHLPVRLLYAGNFGDKDGVENLIEAFEQVAAQRPGIEFLLTGKGVAERMAVIEARIAASPVASRIRYLGFLSDEKYFDVLRGCDIPCVVRVPSEFADRGFPFKLGEYLATGRPVIAAPVSDVGLYLEDRVSAMLVEPGSVAGIVEAIEYLLVDEARALAIGRAGRVVAEREFDARRNGRRLLELIERMDGGAA